MDNGLDTVNIVIAAVAVVLGLFLLLSQGRDKLRMYFAFMNITMTVWLIANHYGRVADASTYPLVALDYSTGTLLALLFWLFSQELRLKAIEPPDLTVKTMNILLAYSLSATVVLIALISGGFIISYDVTADPPIGEGSLSLLYPLIIFTLAILSINNLFQSLRKSRDRIQKERVKFVFAGLTIAFIGIAIPNLVLQNVLPANDQLLSASKSLPEIGVIIFLALSTYAIIKRGLFDLKLAAVRTLGYIGVLVTLSLLYYALAYVLSVVVLQTQISDTVSASPINVVIAIFLAFLFQPIKSAFDRWTDNIFYRDVYKTEDFFARLSVILSSTTDLRGLLERASVEIARTLKSSQVFFLVYFNSDKAHHISAGTHGYKHIAIHEASLIDQLAAEVKKPIIQTETLDEFLPVYQLLSSHKVDLTMPLRQNDTVSGYVFLGEHQSSRYSNRDLSVLGTIANELSIAIQNSLSLQEVKQLNATLQERVDIATKQLRSSNAQLMHVDEVKDEFISMASHQLRTPLTSIKGYLSMVLDGDVGEVSPKQRALLGESFKSSERMVRLITDFLNVSRLQTGKFTIEKSLFDLNDVVDQEVKDLSVIAKNRLQQLRYETSGQPVPVMADESKIRQVIMNYIDNAIYYSRPNSTVVIELSVQHNKATVTVRDTGIGVPHAAQQKLFTKFYRAENARKQRPDGTGVGLYLARRVIEAHNGSIVFHSTEGHGSTFGFSIPVAKEQLPTAKAAEEAIQEEVLPVELTK